MRRILLVSFAVLVLLAIASAGIGWYLLNDQDFLKARLGAVVLNQTGRNLAVDGPLQLDLGRQAIIEARGIRFQDADWADSADMVSLGHLRVVVDLPSLFGDIPVIPSLSLEDCDIRLATNEAGVANWDVLPETSDDSSSEPEPGSGPPVALLDANIRNCRLTHSAPERTQPLTVAVDELRLQLVDDARWQGSGAGNVDGEMFSFNAEMEPAGALLQGEPVRYELGLGLGEVSLQSSGSIEDPATGRGAELAFSFSGPEMATVLERFALPAFSEGPFDFRLILDSVDSVTELRVDGDLGNLELNASGHLDRLLQPQSGALRMNLSGPDLQALGAALRVHDLVPEPFEMQSTLSIEDGITRVDALMLETNQDRVEIAGVVGRAPRLAESDLTVQITTGDIGRWRQRASLPVTTVGPAALDANVYSDGGGMFSVEAQLSYTGSTLSVDGRLGSVEGGFEPDLNIGLESADAAALGARFAVEGLPAAGASVAGRISLADSLLELSGVEAALGGHRAAVDGVVNPSRPFTGTAADVSLATPDLAELGRLVGQEALPAGPLTVQGHVSRPDQRLQFNELNLDLAGHKARIDGYLNPEEGFSGSEIEVEVDSPDVSNLALLFGTDGLPHEALNLTAVLRQEGKGLAFRTRQGSVGEITLAIDGRMPDLTQPTGVDADFDVRLPSLALLAFLAPEADWPDLPFSARGKLNHEQALTRLDDVQLELGTFAADVSGELFTDQRFAVTVAARGPDASQLEPWVGRPLPPLPVSVGATLEGSPTAFEVSNLAARLGPSEVEGALQIGLGESRSITGRLESAYIDASRFRTAEPEEEPADTAQQSPYVFDETPVVGVDDFGTDVDLELKVAELDLGHTQILDIDLGIGLAGRRLELSLLAMRGVGGGTVSGGLLLDASGAAPELELDMTARDLRLGLAAAENQEIETYPPVDADITLTGAGVTLRQLAASLNGKVRSYTRSGQIATSGLGLILNDFLTELLSALNPFSQKNEYTTLDCSVTAATIVDGQVEVFPVVYQTEQLTILTQGKIDLHTEEVDLSFNTKPRKGIGISAGILINPLIKVGGTLKQPAIELDPAGAAVSGGLAVATVGISLLAKSTFDRFLSSKDPCGDARKEIAERDQAPPP